MSQLKVAILQSDIIWENPKENREAYAKKLATILPDTELVVFPEMFTSGFTMNANEIAEGMEGETVSWIKKMAEIHRFAILGSLIIKVQENKRTTFKNRLLFITPDGKIQFYDKRHTFTLAKENQVYERGHTKLIVSYKGWKICPLICYDLRFPVWARNTENYDLLLYVANWPTPRISAWDTLLRARAIENMSYTIGVNRVGFDDNGYEYSGNSACYDTMGKCLVKNNKGEAVIMYVTLDKEKQNLARNKFHFLSDMDTFSIL
ncbi:amidohydrolase [Tenacibaculum sp. SG-28]|uniref:amidohydrolase n=1 Tax=Tenacibaculum sp. SG-28 TaxID=754426 RepID=UPI000CF55D3B|nr:amidohydrolase [Tenacibaculum sp. SG-28]PQJ21916.1 nitrilase family protein [Tenacibaculum sp. SG-28]